MDQRRQASMAYQVWDFSNWEGTANPALIFLQQQREADDLLKPQIFAILWS
jgi:hypothetical protein